MLGRLGKPMIMISVACGAIPAPLIASQRAGKAVVDAFTRQVDPTLVIKGFSLNKLGSIRLNGSSVDVFVYEAVFGEAQRVTRRLVFMGAHRKFLGMYGNFSESATRVSGGRIFFETDPAYKNEDCINLSGDRLPDKLKFRGEEFQLFGFKEVK